MEVIVSAELFPTEDPERVKKAVSNLFDLEVQLVKKDGKTSVIGSAKNKKSLNKLYSLIRSQYILDSARKILKSSIDKEKVVFELNKQAAYMGIVNFLKTSQDDISKSHLLGSIRVEIRDKEIDKLIDWLAPSTI
jgi:hypothetical protein